MEQPQPPARSATAAGAAPAAAPAALLRPPGAPVPGKGDSAPRRDPAPVVEPDGTEDPWANADDGVVPEQSPERPPEPPAHLPR